MRVLFVTVNFPPNRAGGAERQALLQATALQSAGVPVDVVCERHPHEDPAPWIRGVRVTRLRTLKPPLERASWCARLAWHIVRHHRSYDLIHVHVANVQADVGVAIGRLLRIPVYVKVASGGISGEVAGRRARGIGLGRWLGLRRATRVQALSPQIRGELIAAGVDGARIVDVPNAVDLSRFTPASPEQRRNARRALQIEEDNLLVVYMGRFARYKGADTILRAWTRSAYPNAHLLMVGARFTEEPIGEIRESATVSVRDWVADPRLVFSAADVFVHPSLADGMPNTVLEAMAMGKTVICAATPAVTNLLTDGTDALLFPPGDHSALSGQLLRVLEDSDLRRRLGDEAHRTSRSYSIDRVRSQLLAAYPIAIEP